MLIYPTDRERLYSKKRLKIVVSAVDNSSEDQYTELLNNYLNSRKATPTDNTPALDTQETMQSLLGLARTEIVDSMRRSPEAFRESLSKFRTDFMPDKVLFNHFEESIGYTIGSFLYETPEVTESDIDLIHVVMEVDPTIFYSVIQHDPSLQELYNKRKNQSTDDSYYNDILRTESGIVLIRTLPLATVLAILERASSNRYVNVIDVHAFAVSIGYRLIVTCSNIDDFFAICKAGASELFVNDNVHFGSDDFRVIHSKIKELLPPVTTVESLKQLGIKFLEANIQILDPSFSISTQIMDSFIRRNPTIPLLDIYNALDATNDLGYNMLAGFRSCLPSTAFVSQYSEQLDLPRYRDTKVEISKKNFPPVKMEAYPVERQNATRVVAIISDLVESTAVAFIRNNFKKRGSLKLPELRKSIIDDLRSGGVSKSSLVEYMTRSQVPPNIEGNILVPFLQKAGDTIPLIDLKGLLRQYQRWMDFDVDIYKNKYQPFSHSIVVNNFRVPRSGFTLVLGLEDGFDILSKGFNTKKIMSIFGSDISTHLGTSPAHCPVGWLSIIPYKDERSGESSWMVWEFQSDMVQSTSNLKRSESDKANKLRNLVENYIGKYWKYILMNYLIKRAKEQGVSKILMPSIITGNVAGAKAGPAWAVAIRSIYDDTAKAYGGEFSQKEIVPKEGKPYAFSPFGFYVIDINNFTTIDPENPAQRRFARRSHNATF